MPTESAEAPSCKPGDEVNGIIEKESRALTDKAVTQIKVPEVILCFNDGACQVVKDICIDKDLQTLGRILLDNNEVGEKLSSVLKSYIRNANDDAGERMVNDDSLVDENLKSNSDIDDDSVGRIQSSCSSSEAGEIASIADKDTSSCIAENKVTLEELLFMAKRGQEMSVKVSPEKASSSATTSADSDSDSMPLKDDVQIGTSPSSEAKWPTDQASGQEESLVDLKGEDCKVSIHRQTDMPVVAQSGSFREKESNDKMDGGVVDSVSNNEMQKETPASLNASESSLATESEECPVNVEVESTEASFAAQSLSILEADVSDKMDSGINDTDLKDEFQMETSLSLDTECSRATGSEENPGGIEEEDGSMDTLMLTDVVVVAQSSSILEANANKINDDGINDTEPKDEILTGTSLSPNSTECSQAIGSEESPTNVEGDDRSMDTRMQSDVVVARQSGSIYENDKSRIDDTDSNDEFQMGTSLSFTTQSDESVVNLKGEHLSVENTLGQSEVATAQSSIIIENDITDKLDSGDDDTSSKDDVQREPSISFDDKYSSQSTLMDESPGNFQSDAVVTAQSSIIHENGDDDVNKLDSRDNDADSRDEVPTGKSIESSHITGREEESPINSINKLLQSDTIFSEQSISLHDENDVDTKMKSEVTNTDSHSESTAALSSEENHTVKDSETILNGRIQVMTEEAVPDSSVASLGGSFHKEPSHLSAPKTSSGHIAFSGSISLRSDSSTTSTRSFAFPVLQSEWNNSPVKMAKANRRHSRKHQCWGVQLLCCKF